MKIRVVLVAFNVRATSAELRYAIEDSRCAMLIIEDVFFDVFEAIEAELSQRPQLAA